MASVIHGLEVLEQDCKDIKNRLVESESLFSERNVKVSKDDKKLMKKEQKKLLKLVSDIQKHKHSVHIEEYADAFAQELGRVMERQEGLADPEEKAIFDKMKIEKTHSASFEEMSQMTKTGYGSLGRLWLEEMELKHPIFERKEEDKAFVNKMFELNSHPTTNTITGASHLQDGYDPVTKHATPITSLMPKGCNPTKLKKWNCDGHHLAHVAREIFDDNEMIDTKLPNEKRTLTQFKVNRSYVDANRDFREMFWGVCQHVGQGDRFIEICTTEETRIVSMFIDEIRQMDDGSPLFEVYWTYGAFYHNHQLSAPTSVKWLHQRMVNKKCSRGMKRFKCSPEAEIDHLRGLLNGNRKNLDQSYVAEKEKGIPVKVSVFCPIKKQKPNSTPCVQCGIVPRILKKCGACQMKLYCSAACKDAHWKEGHKTRCAGPGFSLNI